MTDDITEQLESAPFNIRQCNIPEDQRYLYGGACLAADSYECPSQSKDCRIILDGVKFVACEKYHSYFKNKK